MAQPRVSTVQPHLPHLGLPALPSITQSPPCAWASVSATITQGVTPEPTLALYHLFLPGKRPSSFKTYVTSFTESSRKPLRSPARCTTASVRAPASLSYRGRKDFCHICSPHAIRNPLGEDEIRPGFICAPESGT
uniref:Uncharacterized protein n=1 Tax=Rousettus aegyptiacus TaxID=9407 RepID=A0A7J8BA61_ROUAE|nr:hypothetical protein HJG63_009909 [Rousettus aegyptiacus]